MEWKEFGIELPVKQDKSRMKGIHGLVFLAFFHPFSVADSLSPGREVICRLVLCRAAGEDCVTKWQTFEPNRLLPVKFPGYVDSDGTFHHAQNASEVKGQIEVAQERETRETLMAWAAPREEIARAILEMKPTREKNPPQIRFVSGIKPTSEDVLQFTDSLISDPFPLEDFRSDAGEKRLLEEWRTHNDTAYTKFALESGLEVGNQLVIVIQDSEGLLGVPITPEEFGIVQSVAHNLRRLYQYEGPRIPPGKVYLIKVTEDPTTGEELIFMADPANEPL